MGILLSFLFPSLFMSSPVPPSDPPSDASRSSSCASGASSTPTQPAAEDDAPDPSPPSSPKSVPIGSPPLDNRPYSLHGVGIGTLSPQPVIGPFAPITRANLSPLHVKSSPSEQRSNPLENISPRSSSNPFEQHLPHASGSHSPEGSQPPTLPPPHLRYVEDTTTKRRESGELIPLAALSSSASSPTQTTLRISLPPPHPTASTSTPSPPLLSPPRQSIASPAGSTSPDAVTAAPLETPTPGNAVDLLVPASDLDGIDFGDFDTDGCSALEKIYLFSQSQASFHRVFIAHALPGYLLGSEVSGGELLSREVIEQITPGEAIVYVLPLLSRLAMDDDESVKEALAAELVPIIWWFVTHCKLVDDDSALPSPPAPTPLSSNASPGSERGSFPRPLTPQLDGHSTGPSAGFPSEDAIRDVHPEAPIEVPVQVFTPILGTLLLSPNGIVGGSARYAVVELLRRLRRADDREDGTREFAGPTSERVPGQSRSRGSPTPSQQEYLEHDATLNVGLFQREQRRLLEQELVYQVVIGMGRLDLEENTPEEPQEAEADDADSGPSTAVPTPQAHAPAAAEIDSYFPAVVPIVLAPAPEPFASAVPPALPNVELVPAVSTATTLSPHLSPSPPGSPGHSSSSTPSLTSSTSSTSGDYPDAPELSIESEQFDISLVDALPSEEPMDLDAPGANATLGRMEMKIDLPPPQQDWMPSSAMTWATAHALPTTPPFEVPPPPPAATSTEPTSPITGFPILQVIALPSASPAREQPSRRAGWTSPRTAPMELQGAEETGSLSGDLSEEAAVGRLASMSLMAAVTASGAISEETKMMFVAEVERVGRDPLYWVRREASFAVGALAKVVSTDVVTSILLPLFESLCRDSTWHVRHSVLFALPAILSRLQPNHRWKLALDVILPLSQDEQTAVRSAVLEALGEVMHTFADDENGPPDELLQLFLGVRETQDPGGTPDSDKSGLPRSPQDVRSPGPPTAATPTSSAWSDYGTDNGVGPDIYDDPQRPLVCAFNYPAVAQTLGRKRWPELRSLYRALSQDPYFKVRRTLAASIGEIAKIIGTEHARADLMDVLRSSLYADESEVRMKVVEIMHTFVKAVASPERAEAARMLQEALASGKLSTWREREGAAKSLGELVQVEGIEPEVLLKMLYKALDDRIAAVREAVVSVLPRFVEAWKMSPLSLDALRKEIRSLATDSTSRRRTTYVMCVQELLASGHGDVVVGSAGFWDTLSALVRDPIVDVRIRASRLIGLISNNLGGTDDDVAERTAALARELAHDGSHDVRSFIEPTVHPPPGPSPQMFTTVIPPSLERTGTTFSRPPPQS
ncbi:armadillo-type protein [Epithele typhae]|uniref:armadillo-type protein n=1 Tax=Epithele typhae TaxID=378194 RepID=UPI002008E24F|nr:armadillo-type protein [Epithele typhae]KAH9945960.1 armadillo-type protein [Epithele typhae]